MENLSNPVGLTTREALHNLYREIESLMVQYRLSQNKKSTKSWIKDSIHHSSQYTTINWISICLLFSSVVSLITLFILKDCSFTILFEAFLILLFLALSLGIQIYDNYLRHNEIYRRIGKILETLSLEVDKVSWKPDNYPSLFMPASPCITLQWTYRDGILINLPYPLLVKDDVIEVRPGQISPGYCECLDRHSEQQILHDREIYAPLVQRGKEVLATPHIKKPVAASRYRLLETPYLKNLKIMLDQALHRPITYLNHQQHVLLVEMVQRFVLPLTMVAFFGMAGVKFFRYKFDDALDLFLSTPTAGILPLLPLIFPIVWSLLNYVGLARLQTIFLASKDIQNKDNFDLEEEEVTIVEYMPNRHKWVAIFSNFVAVLKGSPDIMARTSNILHVLGSVTALCCVDKKGLLSWPNPTAEKVFFLHNSNVSPASSLVNVGDLEMDSFGGTPKKTSDCPQTSASIEVLDLTHNHHDPFKLHFDDPNWENHLPSLKPLGLAVLLNTCNFATEEQYNNFCSHITCEALYSENLIPVTNRRCLCELATEIGFVDEAQKIFNLEEKLCTFRHLHPETVRRDNKYARSLQMSNAKVKVPFPHMFAVVVREISTGAMQLLSEGTADVLLDSCIDYWDGKDVCRLTSADRKRIQDFYQRTSLTAYCTAFAYRPLNRAPAACVASSYLELPSDCKHLYMAQRSPTSILGNNKGVLEPLTGNSLPLFYSTDSLLYANEFEAEEVDADGCFQMQCNQVFIGMVSMQYQVLTDMVQLIEQLERACVRFVHFSKENELRSRVFSEKMGLESGWNCHISLLSERNSSNLENLRGVSVSAPSMINLDQTTVRFDTQIRQQHSSDQSTVNEASNHNQDALANSHYASHDWQSMSCLTDSTDQSAPIHFDMSNRAKLPRGIDKIRPHIELIDNVPLLVSLFTDCTPSATKEMLQIMQENGEIVCIIGSSANCDNTGIFMQADASVAIEPLYPQICQKRSLLEPPVGTSPIDLARELSSLACSFCMKREDPINLYHLIMESRHFVLSLWNTVQFWVCCCATLTGMQMVCSMGFLPSPLTVGQILWLTVIVIPLLSASLTALPVDSDVMKRALGKNNVVVNWDIFWFICWCYGSKFLPTVITVMLTFWGSLSYHCEQFCRVNNCTCFMHHTPSYEDGIYKVKWNHYWAVESTRSIILFIVVLHFATISISFVHRGHSIFKKLPHTNRLWFVIVLILIVVQCIYTYLTLVGEDLMPLWVSIGSALSPLVVFFFNELVKMWEIGVNDRFQKRARLDFGTKLGMNSPF